MSDYDLTPYGAGGALTPSPSGGAGLPVSSPAEFGGPDYWLPEGDVPHGVTAPPLGSFFGQPTGVKPAELQQFVDGIAQLATDELRSRGVHPPYIAAIVNWFRYSAQRPLKPQYSTHNYNVANIPIAPEDKVPIVAFLNAMDDAGVPPAVIRLALSWYYIKLPQLLEATAQPSAPSLPSGNYALYDQLDDKTADYVERRSHSDMATCENILRTRWGNDYQKNVATVARYVSKLPPQDRYFIENAVARDGIFILNDASVFEELWRIAVGITAPSKDVEAEIASIEKLMKAGSPEYWRSDVTQARYRQLLTMRDGG